MPHNYYDFKGRDSEKRLLRIANDQLKRSLDKRIKNQKELKAELKKLQRERILHEGSLNHEIERLKTEVEKLRRERDMYKKMLFKESISSQSLPGKDEELNRFSRRF